MSKKKFERMSSSGSKIVPPLVPRVFDFAKQVPVYLRSHFDLT